MSTTLPFKELERTVLYDEVSRHLKQAIVDGMYQPGDRLPSERDLAEAFGVSRPTVREALKILAMQGLVNMDRRQAGYVISQPDISQHIPSARNLLTWLAQVNESTIDAFLEVIPYLRGMVAHAALKNRDSALDADLAAIIRTMREGEQSFYAVNPLAYAFTLRLAEASGNGMMVAIWRIFQDILCEKIPHIMTTFEPEGPGRLIAYHEKVAQAVARGSHEGIDRAILARRKRIEDLNAASRSKKSE